MNCLGLIANHAPTRPLTDSDMPSDLGYLNPDLPGMTVAVGNGGPPWGIPIDHCYLLDYNRIQTHDDYVRGRHGVAHVDDYLMIVAYSVTPDYPEVYFPYEIIYGGVWFPAYPSDRLRECCEAVLTASLKRIVDHARRR